MVTIYTNHIRQSEWESYPRKSTHSKNCTDNSKTKATGAVYKDEDKDYYQVYQCLRCGKFYRVKLSHKPPRI